AGRVCLEILISDMFMRTLSARLLAVLIALLIAPAAAQAAKSGTSDQFSSHEKILQWIDGYRLDPEPKRMPDAVKALSRLGLFRDMDGAGVFVGFMAGVLNSNPQHADAFVRQMFPMPPEDQSAIIKAIAYSGLPNWKDLMRRYVERMPARKVMIES